MTKLDITDELKKSLFNGKSTYVKGGTIIFDRVSFQEVDAWIEISIYNCNTKLATAQIRGYFPGCLVHFRLTVGRMELEIL